MDCSRCRVLCPVRAARTNRFTMSVVQAFSGLRLHHTRCPSSHANVACGEKKCRVLKTWQTVKEKKKKEKEKAVLSIWSPKCDRGLQEEDPRLVAWRWVRGGRATCFLFLFFLPSHTRSLHPIQRDILWPSLIIRDEGQAERMWDC